ncbi:hypothetical protein C1J03_18750 [Sulfitobacter sp. SK012]|nr:hypothetical protein C1J03_18750 [Sulfitobacter sp. SK012]
MSHLAFSKGKQILTADTYNAPFPYARLRRTISISVTLTVAAIIAALTLLPINLPTSSAPGPDKVHHLIAFAALTFPCAVIYRRAVRWIAPSALLYGILIELIQPHVGRQGELADFYADALGAMLGLGLGLAANSLLVRPLARRYLNQYA